jgi:hypothetical protein
VNGVVMTELQDSPPPVRAPSLLDALIPLVALAVLIAGSLALFGMDALDGPIQDRPRSDRLLTVPRFCDHAPATERCHTRLAGVSV